MNKAQLKELVCQAIDARYGDIEKVAMDIFAEPELGFKEEKTSAKVKAAFDQLGMNYTDGWGITGVKARMKGGNQRKPLLCSVNWMPSFAVTTPTVIRSRGPRIAAVTMCRSAICLLLPWPLKIQTSCSISMVTWSFLLCPLKNT